MQLEFAKCRRLFLPLLLTPLLLCKVAGENHFPPYSLIAYSRPYAVRRPLVPIDMNIWICYCQYLEQAHTLNPKLTDIKCTGIATIMSKVLLKFLTCPYILVSSVLTCTGGVTTPRCGVLRHQILCQRLQGFSYGT